MPQAQETHYLIFICDVSRLFSHAQNVIRAPPASGVDSQVREVVERGDSDAAVGKNFVPGM